MTADKIARLEALLEKATPVDDMPAPWGEDRHYGPKEIERLETDKAIRAALPELLKAARDAERYRWLRVRGCAIDGSDAQKNDLVRRCINLDDEIDAAMKEASRG